MFKCNDCGKTFHKCNRVEDCVGEFWGVPANMTLYECPHCGSENIEYFDDEADKAEEEKEIEQARREDEYYRSLMFDDKEHL